MCERTNRAAHFFGSRPSGTGQVVEFPLPKAASPLGITAGPESSLWATERSNHIARISSNGRIAEFPIFNEERNTPSAIATGPEGDLWFTEPYGNNIDRFTPAGQITKFTLQKGSHLFGGPESITPGPEDDLWFTSLLEEYIGRMTSSGQVTEFPIPPEQLPATEGAANAELQMGRKARMTASPPAAKATSGLREKATTRSAVLPRPAS